MTIAPKEPKDLALAPVAVAIDVNLQRLRDKSPAEIDYQLTLELNQPADSDSSDERASRVLDVALRDVDLHHWSAKVTDDGSRLRLWGGSVSLDLGLSATLLAYIRRGVAAAA
jgi:hypothetical protein